MGWKAKFRGKLTLFIEGDGNLHVVSSINKTCLFENIASSIKTGVNFCDSKGSLQRGSNENYCNTSAKCLSF